MRNRISFLLIGLMMAFGMATAQRLYTIETGQFDKLKVNANANVIYRNVPDSTGYAAYTTVEDNPDLFVLTVKNGTLRIQQGETQWKDNALPTLYVYSDFLTSVESSSDRSVIVENLAPCATFGVNLIGNGTIVVENIKSNTVSASITTGNGTINLSGKCNDATFKMVGAGLISADRLCADNVKCKILGTGSIGCWPVDNLGVRGIGSTKIYYKGKPNIKKIGGGKLLELPEEEIPQRGARVDSFLYENDD